MPLRDVCTPHRLSDSLGGCAGRGREGAVSHITPPAQIIKTDMDMNIYVDSLDIDMNINIDAGSI